MARKRKAARKGIAATAGMLEAEVRGVGKKLNTLVAQARKAEASARARTMRQLRLLQGQQAAANRALAKLGRQGVAASGPVIGGLQKAWRDMELAMRQAAKRFRETA